MSDTIAAAMSGPQLRPAAVDRLVWIAPGMRSIAEFEKVRGRLEALVRHPSGRCVYEAKRRAIHRLVDEDLGPVAVKEVRSEGRLRAIWFRLAREHPALREFRVGCGYLARGGRTPELLGAAVEGGHLGVERVMIFMHWVDDAVDLTAHLRTLAPDPPDSLLEAVAARILADARLGLVHGRHGTGNLLVVPDARGEPELQVIDFAYSRLEPQLDRAGLRADAARVAVQMVRLGGVSREKVRTFVGLCADGVGATPDDAARERAAIQALASRRLRETTGHPL